MGGAKTAAKRRKPISTTVCEAPGRTAATGANLAQLSPAVVDPSVDLQVNVLLVDDQPANLIALEAVLENLGLQLVKARSGIEALGHLLRQEFALILMDVKMPGMNGFETAELIRRRERCRSTPIIFLTAVETAEAQMFKGYSLGAVDYLLKPIVPQVLRSKVAVFVDIFRKAEQIKQQAERLREMEQREYQRQLAEAKAECEAERMREEIRIAREIQQKLFPAAPLPLPGFDIAGASFPAEATGGDYFDYIPMDDGGLAVVIGDVSGHGYGPALLMAEVRAYLRAFLLTRTDVGEIVGLVNRALAGDTDDRFATLLLARLDPRSREFVYASAGHVPGYLLTANGDIEACLPSTGIPLAVLPDADFETGLTRTLQPGETVVLLTDGIIEAHGPDQKLFGIDRAFDVVRGNRHRPAREIIHALYETVHDFCGAQGHYDDMTVIVIKVEDDGRMNGESV